MRGQSVGSLIVFLGVFVVGAQAQEVQWRPASKGQRVQQPDNPGYGQSPIASPMSAPFGVQLGCPTVQLGRPIPMSASTVAARPPIADAQLSRVSFQSGASLAPPQPVVRGQSPDTLDLAGSQELAPPPSSLDIPAPAYDPYNCGAPTPPPQADNGNGFWGKCLNFCGHDWPWGKWQCFKSDHAFDTFISPVTNPFLAEDPRSLTQIRPVFIGQGTPTRNTTYRGGDLAFFGLQGSVAITDRWSLVLNKVGGLWSEPHSNIGEFTPHSGFSEVWFGPQWTFIRSERTGTLAALGVTVQTASGSSKVYQDTGSLSLAPYLALGQRFWRTSWGTFHVLNTTGYSVATDSLRSDYFYDSLHLDYDIGNLHKIYPLVELNYFHYTAGKARSTDFEGRDLINFGSSGVGGQNDLTVAGGLRYKFYEWWQMGVAAEFPITSRRELLDYRITVDMIFKF